MSTALIQSLSEVVLPLLADVLLKSTVLLTAAFAAAWMLRRAPAATRHVVWSATLVGLLALPVLSLAVPRFNVPVSLPWAEAPVPEVTPRAPIVLPPAERVVAPPGAPVPALPAIPRAARATGPVAGAATDEAESPPPVLMASREGPPAAALPGPPFTSPHDPHPTARSTPALVGLGLVLLWAAGLVFGLGWIIMGGWCVAQLRQSCTRVSDGPMLALIHELGTALGIRRPITLLQTRRRSIPMTWGVLRPVVLLPHDAATWPAERLRLVL